MKRKGVLLISLFIIWPLGQVYAKDARWYMTPSLLQIAPDSARQAEQNTGLQIGIGKSVSPLLNMEWNFVKDVLHQKAGPLKFKQQGWSLDGIRFLHEAKAFSLYGLLGMGLLKTELEKEEGYRLMVNLGVGAMRYFWGSDQIKIRSDIRYRIDEWNAFKEGRFEDWVFHLGLILPLEWSSSASPTTSAPLAPTPLPPPDIKDTDQDGVPDGGDACPMTPRGTPVNDIGCKI